MTSSRTATGGTDRASPARPFVATAAWAAVALCAVRAVAQAPAAPTSTVGPAPLPAAERIPRLSTSDGVPLAAWYYPAVQAEADNPIAAPVVILLHDLAGSHETVAPLARDLQARGIAVVAPDLRGHGASVKPGDRGVDALKAVDFKNMAITSGGRFRTDAEDRGDVETVRNWIKAQADRGTLDLDRLVVVGSGVGAAVAAHWTVLDGRWPDLASGPQGRQVRGLVLVSPAVTTRGFAIAPALAADPLRTTVPILILAGTKDAEAVRIYEQVKRQRPEAWSERRAGQADATSAPKLPAGTAPSVYLRQSDADLSGDRLATLVPRNSRGVHPAAAIAAFLDVVTTAEP